MHSPSVVSQWHACELHSPSVVIWLWGEGSRRFAPWSRLTCFCTCTVLGLVTSPDHGRLRVSDFERVLYRSSVDHSVVCRTLVLPLSSFFGLSTYFPSPPFDFPSVRAPRESVSLFFSFEFCTRLHSLSPLFSCLFALSAHYLTGAY